MIDRPAGRRAAAAGRPSRAGGTADADRLAFLPLAVLLAVLITALSGLAGPSARVLAQAADELDPDITMTAEPLLDGNVRRGQWAAVRVHLENDGPAVDGELRISGMDQGAATYSVVIQLATGAWYDPVKGGIGALDRHGNPNVLTRDEGCSKLSQGSVAHSTLVEVERFDGVAPPVESFAPPAIKRR